MTRRNLAFLFSLFFHLFIAGLFNGSWHSKTDEKRPTQTQEITFLGGTSTQKNSLKTSQPKIKSRTSKAQKVPTKFNREFFRLSTSTNEHFGSNNGQGGGSASGSPTAGGYGDSESLQGVLLRGKPLEALASRIANSMSYHQVLIDNDVQGKVSINLEVTPTLKLVQLDKPVSANGTLGAFVYVSLMSIFKKDLENAKLPSSPDNLHVRLHFTFKTQINYPGQSTKDYDIVDPSIRFHFVAYREPYVLRWMNENLPVVPIPGGIIINVGAVVKMIEDWDKVDPDTRREQLLRNFSDGLIQKAAN